MPEEEGMQGGNIFTNRIMGIPGVVWLIGAGVLAYFIFFRSRGSAGSPSTSGGGGEINQSGATTTIQSGAVKVDVTQNQPSAADIDQQPKPPPPPRQQRLDYRQLAIQALEDKGIQNPTPQQIADEQNDIRSTVGLGPATGTPPPGGGTDVGVLPPTKKKPAPQILKPRPKPKPKLPPRRPPPRRRV